MFVCKSLAPARIGRGSWLGFGVALVVLSGAPSVAVADSGRTAGGTVGGAVSRGTGFVKSEFSGHTISQASEGDRKTGVSVKTVSKGYAEARSLSKHGGSFAKVKTTAVASAKKHKKTLSAFAAAGVEVAAGAVDGSGQVLVLTSSGSLAYAESGKTLSAYALSGTGASAYAEADGHKFYTTASIPDGTTTAFMEGGWSYSFAYTTTGSFAIAISSKKSVSAMTGTSTEAGAFASGDLKAFLESSTFAAAYADTKSASAFAAAMGYGLAESGFESSSAFSSSWASATITISEHGKTGPALTVAASKGCDSIQWLQKSKITDHCNIEF